MGKNKEEEISASVLRNGGKAIIQMQASEAKTSSSGSSGTLSNFAEQTVSFSSFL